MITRTASAAALGAAALVVGMLLAQPARPATNRASAATDPARVRAALQSLQSLQSVPTPRTRRPPAWRTPREEATTADTTAKPRFALSLALCHDCAASLGLVRVLNRRQAHGLRTVPMLVFTDRRWPALDTLAHTTASTVVVVPDLPTRVGVSPVALVSTGATLRAADRAPAQAPAPAPGTVLIGLPDTATCLSVLSHAGPDASPLLP